MHSGGYCRQILLSVTFLGTMRQRPSSSRRTVSSTWLALPTLDAAESVFGGKHEEASARERRGAGVHFTQCTRHIYNVTGGRLRVRVRVRFQITRINRACAVISETIPFYYVDEITRTLQVNATLVSTTIKLVCWGEEPDNRELPFSVCPHSPDTMLRRQDPQATSILLSTLTQTATFSFRLVKDSRCGGAYNFRRISSVHLADAPFGSPAELPR